ncbi:putative cyanate hydratase [Endogone sp. FLAS-F59071]|nr:putative cyanate hydratase [Endogone sp. FLAS-F59071]|eukprot:RUS20187.1 putative cyanate hydratase [Endogone sp. FLAS-F59071]
MEAPSSQFSKLPPISARLFEAKKQKKLSFEQLGKRIGRSEVWVAAVFYGQAKPTEDDIRKLSDALDCPESYLTHDIGQDFFPDRGGLMSVPPTDPTLYRFYEILQVYGYPLKAIIHEKFGDGIMSAIDFTMDVDKIENPAGNRVKITMDGKFLPYKKW